MSYPTWQSSRQHTSSYIARRPWDSPLYRLIYHYRDELEYRWSETFEEKYGLLRREVLDAFDRYLNCGILRHGAARARCEKCNHSMLIAFSCKRRGVCPSCQAKRGVLFAEHLNEEVLLQQPHRHLVFSIPKRLRVYFRYDRSLFRLLYRAAWETWSEHVSETQLNGNSGAVMALHTAGDLLHWHPHIHCIALNGTVLDDGHFLELQDVDSAKLEQRFSEKVFGALLGEELLSEDAVQSMKSWSHSGFNVHVGEPIQSDDENARLFLARYLRKAPLAESRLSIDESGLDPTVVYQSPGENDFKVVTFSALQFLAELSLHIPDTFEQTTRYYGIYSSSHRGKVAREQKYRLMVENNFKSLEQEEEKKLASASFARCMKKVFDIDPLECPKCGEQMKIVAFLHNRRAIEKIATNLGYATWRAPPDFALRRMHIDSSSEYSQITE